MSAFSAFGNHAFIRELSGEAALLAWLDRQGISLEEAALVQPSYCISWADECFCFRQEKGVVEVTVETGIEHNFTGTVTAVYGQSIHAVGEVVAGHVSELMPAAGDQLVATDSLTVAYRIGSDGSVDTSTCQSTYIAEPPPPAKTPLSAVIQNLLGECYVGLGNAWTKVHTACDMSVSSSANGATSTSSGSGTTASSSSTGAGGAGGAGGGGSSVIRAEQGGCSSMGVAHPPGGAAVMATLLLGGAIHLRHRRARR